MKIIMPFFIPICAIRVPILRKFAKCHINYLKNN